MKPILFEKDATDFTTLGIARLPDCISCLVTESLQGEFELEMVYPVSGRMFEEITEDRIIVVPPSDGGSKQAFRIYRITTPIDGKVEISARHISYQLNYIISAANTINIPQNTTPEGAYLLATQFAPMQNPFNFASEITTVKRYQVPVARSVRTILGGMENSIIDIWGGELIWDNWQIHHVQRRGSDNGVRITYGKNLTAVSRSVDIGSAVTGVVAYYLSDDVDPISRQQIVVYTNPRVIYSDDPSGFAYERVVAVDATGEFEEQPTVEQLTAWAQEYIAKTELKSIIYTVTVDFVPLWQSPEYKDYAPLERVSLGDTVYIGYRQLGISVKKRVTATVYDVLANRYESIELGGEPTLSDTIATVTTEGNANKTALDTLTQEVNALKSTINTQDDWTWIEFESGLIIGRAQKSLSYTPSTAAGNIYRTASAISLGTLPFSFSSGNISVMASQVQWAVNPSVNASTGAISCYFCSTTNTAKTPTAQIIFVGFK